MCFSFSGDGDFSGDGFFWCVLQLGQPPSPADAGAFNGEEWVVFAADEWTGVAHALSVQHKKQNAAWPAANAKIR